MTGLLQGQSVLVVGRGGGIARAVTIAARDAGAKVTAAGRDRDTLAAAYAGEPAISTQTVDLTDDVSIAARGEQLGGVDHVVSTASARARGHLAALDREAIRLSFDTKVIGPLMLAKHLAPRMDEGGSFTLFAGVAAAKITVGTSRSPDTAAPGPSPARAQSRKEHSDGSFLAARAGRTGSDRPLPRPRSAP